MPGQFEPVSDPRVGSLRRSLAAALIVFLLAAVASYWMVRQSEQQRIIEQRSRLADQVDDHAHLIQRNIERALSATYALAGLVRQSGGKIDNFEATAIGMLPYYPGAASLQLAPGGVIREIAPLAGNEKAIGHNLLADPTRNKEAFLARDTGKLTLAGPFELLQGGLGAVGRLPVFFDDGPGQRVLWGFTTVLIRFPQVLDDARLRQQAKEGFSYELSRIHPDSGVKQIIAASPTALIDPVARAIQMPNGQWTLSMSPVNGWGDAPGLWLKAGLGLLFSLLMAYLAKALLELSDHKRHLEELVLQRTSEISATQGKLQATFDAIPDLVWLKDSHGVYLDCNPMFVRFVGGQKADIFGKTDDDFTTKALADIHRQSDRQAIASNQAIRNEEHLTFADGYSGIFETTKTTMRDAQGEVVGVLGLAHDISKRRAAEVKIERLTQLYAALSQCNQAIVRCNSEGELFSQICRDVVAFGGMKMAWIGLLSGAERKIKVVASHGDGLDYLRDLHLSGNPEQPEGLGSTGVAIRTRQPVWVQDFLNDPLTAPWAERGAQFGWRSSAKLPLLRKGELIGTFGIYSGEVNAFDESARNLLIEMAADISFALDGFDRDAERKRALTDLRHSTMQYDKLVSRIPVGVYIMRSKAPGVVSLDYASSRTADMFQVSVDELMANPEVVLQMIHPDDIDKFMRVNKAEIDTNQPFSWVGRVQGGDSSQWLKIVASPELQADGDVLWHGLIEDVTERRQAQEKLQLSASVFTHAHEGIMITTADGTILDVNDAFSVITGYSREEVLGQNPRILRSGRQGKDFYTAMWTSLREQGHWYGEVWNRRKNGELFAEMQTISTVRDSQGRAQHYVALFSDISAIKAHQSHLEHIAHYDTLTNLPNRALLADRLHQAMAQAMRHGQRLAVAYLDLDGFKAINDRHGHDAGDHLLIAVAARMKSALREGDSLARLGGDEFVAVLLDLADVDASLPMLKRLLGAAAEPVQFGDLVLEVSASLGVTFYPQNDEVDADQLLRQADQAMYQAKLAGKNRYHFFDAEQDRSIRGYHESLDRIRQAMLEREFVLHYQPKVNMRSGRVIGAEALIRWQHPQKGLLWPAAFLSVIENHPLAIDVGEWVLDTVLTQIAQWRAAGLDLHVSVNIGAHQLQRPDFVERLRALLARHPQILAGDLELEILETSALEELVHVSRVIEDCRALGVSFALDDFGTGYSSLTYLKRLAVKQLKIDQSFVRDMLDDPDDLAILEGVIGLAGVFHREVIAEGVETLAHGQVLLQLGCDLAQGYGIARPMAAHEMLHWVANWQIDPSWRGVLPVGREDLPLIFAGAEHRAWILAMGSYLRGAIQVSPPLDHHLCNFGNWLDTEGRKRHGGHPAFSAVEALHRDVHEFAGHLSALRDSGQVQEAAAHLPELEALRDDLLGRMQALLRKTSSDLSNPSRPQSLTSCIQN